MQDLTEPKGRQLALIKNTIAADCTDAEFDLFVEAAKSYRLDPFRKQIIPLVFSKNNAGKRRMSIVVTRDGLRIMAQRCGNYRPATKPAEYVIDEALKSPTNPLGILCARITLWQRDDHSGDWYEVAGEAYWDEFAPVMDEWAYDEQAGTRKPTGRKTVENNWARMPRVMIAKCAEAQALRAGWPDQFSGVYVQEEMDKAVSDDLTASEVLEQQEEARRLARVSSADSIMIVWLPGMPLEPIAKGVLADRIIEWLDDDARTAEQIEAFSEMNAYSLREFWARAKNDALEVKKAIGARLNEVRRLAA